MNSSESPGRKNPMSRPLSANTMRASEGEATLVEPTFDVEQGGDHDGRGYRQNGESPGRLPRALVSMSVRDVVATSGVHRRGRTP